MTESPSFLTESTRISSIRNRNPPTISFFGRPGDPRKGLISFIDALSILCELTAVPTFSVWIVGGSGSETAIVKDIIEARPQLAAIRARGGLTIWGRVGTEALAELYSRASLVIMPSAREQFGIVAIEAMMCGTPVLATRVGGLADIIIDGHTGTLIDLDSPASLANAILGYLRNPDRVEREGCNGFRWSRLAFTVDETYASFDTVYRGGELPIKFPDRALLRQHELGQLRASVIASMGEDCALEDVSSSDHTSAIVRSSSGRFFCKWYRPERADHISVLPVAYPLHRERTLQDYVGRLTYHQHNPAVPDVFRLPTEQDPAAIFPYHETARLANPIPVLVQIAEAFRSYRPIAADDPAGCRYLEALRAFIEKPSLDRIVEHDLAAALLNVRITDGQLRFQQVHPHVELLRMQLLLQSNAWAISPGVRERFVGATAFVMDQSTVPLRLPEMCHGSLKPEHLLRKEDGSFVACDTDSSRYVVGPFDEVHDVWNLVSASTAFGPVNATSRLASMIDDTASRSVAMAWLLVYLIFDALLCATMGRDITSARAIRFCHDLPYVWKRWLTQ
jgi:hypothetical protein